jgi:hypothetical protein
MLCGAGVKNIYIGVCAVAKYAAPVRSKVYIEVFRATRHIRAVAGRVLE